ncbi:MULTISPECIES: HlyD family secretion protein [Vibrio]|uniref:Inner membrane protein YiaV n=1 Tax=Vibrio celticus TaxID=446372 RepID=A0A1C3JD37_9VIBR|nr:MULTISPECIES: HlyD family secretion protein [Vibrio]ROS67591.1 multidrug resistance efflux pump [Vibrio crassostreae]RPF24376.1 multidrug resistance efflux pump [Vibrio crassostreae]TCN83888.1 multidrug resistance efflux pump [Vibrio crassostreae]CAK2696191.1 Inner membrane protein YiaV [Vibrio crassostreae]CAK2696748.1 Inner membrane protein YiaV [Vibrio crassostreae]
MKQKQVFKRTMKILGSVFVVLFVYLIIADRRAPFTTEGRVYGQVVQIAPEVTSRVIRVFVENNEVVEKGDVLFELDSSRYQIALEQAELSLKAAKEQERSLYAQKKMAIASISRAEASYKNAQTDYLRIAELAKNQAVSASYLDNVFKQYQVASSVLEIEKHNLSTLVARLGEAGQPTTDVLLAENRVKQAQLDLMNTTVRSQSDGVVTNLRLEVGAMATANMPLITLISDGSMWVAADFREKSVAHVQESYRALVTFDAHPGQIFDYRVASRDLGVASAHQTPNGTLTQIEGNNRWVRDAQRTRINLQSDGVLPSPLFVGSRATLALYSNDNRFWGLVAKMRIRLVSWFHFIY